jgi:multisubunit Na+/H+ antiporter MnhG subunit
MSLIYLVLSSLTAFLLLVAAIAFLKAKDVFIMAHILVKTNLYVVPLFLISVVIEKFSWIALGKILLIILLNFIITMLLCHLITRRALINKILPDAKEIL